MRKNATKIAAMMLSLALTVTSVNVPTTSSAASKVKLNKSSATLYVGGASSKKTTTLKATFNGKNVKATFTSSNAKVAKVAKTTGKVTAVKKGSATITAKYKSKKATCKVTVKQYVTGVTVNPATVELTEGELIDLSKSVTVSPASASNKALSYKSGDSLIAAVNGTGTILKAVKEGTTTITVKAKDGSNKKATVVVNVKAAEVEETPAPSAEPSTEPTATPEAKEAKNVEVTLGNPFSADYKDAVLVGNNAEVNVKVTDEDGNPVANKEVVLASKAIVSTGATAKVDYSNLSHTVLTTDAKGCATFVYGLDKTKDANGAIDATRLDYVASFKLTASVVGKSEVKGSKDVKFAAIAVNAGTGIKVKNLATGYAKLEPSTNGNVNGTALSSVTTTTDRNGNAVDYVTSQQVSADGVDHSIVFKSDASGLTLVVPGSETSEVAPEDIKETINFSTEKYSTYTQTTNWAKVIDSVNAADLQYATINFGKLSLSKYSRFIVRAYLVTDKNNPTATKNNTITNIPLTDAGAYVVGEKVAKDFSVQIPVKATNGYLYVTAQVESKGQVNTDVNEGFTVKSVVGVKKKGASAVGGNTNAALKGLSVEWAQDTEATYTLDKALSAGPIKTYLDGVLNNNGTQKYAGCTYEYRVPAFPRTGNAIITVLDSNKKAVAYYAIPTTNESKVEANGTVTYLNQNVLTNDISKMYLISADEALNTVGTVTTDANGDAKVDSQKTGVTHVIGTITSTNENIKIDATNKLIYTSVNWNPVPTKAAGAPGVTRKIGAALIGQQITLKAQLADKNGNPVTTAGVGIDFYNDNVKILAGDSTVDEASVIKVDTETNTLGQAELTLVSGKPAQVIGLSAKTNANYNLTYVLGKETVTANYVDLYWVDANLYFEPDANTVAKAETTFEAPVVDTKDVLDVNPTVGSNWAYEVRTNGDLTDSTLAGQLTGYSAVTLTGLAIQTSVGYDSVGTVTNNANGKANVTSTKAGTTRLVNTLNNASISNDMKFVFTGAGKANIEVANVGTGVPTLDKKLTVSINWNAGVPTAEVVIPTSLKADVNVASVPVYVVVKDANGNPLKDKAVTLRTTGAGAIAVPTVNTDSNGVAAFTVTPNGATAGQSSALTATVAGLTGTYTSSIKWVNVSGLAALKVTKVAYDYTAKTIKLTFNNEIYAPSVIAEQFTVVYGGKSQLVTEVAVAGNVVTLKVPALATVNGTDPFTVTIADAQKADNASITYGFVSVDGQNLVGANNTVTFKADGTIQ